MVTSYKMIVQYNPDVYTDTVKRQNITKITKSQPCFMATPTFHGHTHFLPNRLLLNSWQATTPLFPISLIPSFQEWQMKWYSMQSLGTVVVVINQYKFLGMYLGCYTYEYFVRYSFPVVFHGMAISPFNCLLREGYLGCFHFGADSYPKSCYKHYRHLFRFLCKHKFLFLYEKIFAT